MTYEDRFTVAQAARQIAAPNESTEPVANQLRRLVQKGLVRTRGQVGDGRTAANLFGAGDIAVARIHRTLIALGIASDDLLRAVEFAAYQVPPGIEGAIEDCQGFEDSAPNWMCGIYMTDPDESGKRHIDAQIFKADHETSRADHPALALILEIPMRSWLVPLANLKSSNG